MNFVYLTTNKINGKQYVGSHNGEINDGYLGSGLLILKAIRKYGKENFKIELLEECYPDNNQILEESYIEKYNTLIPNGYNISPTGGHGLKQSKLNETTKQKIKSKQKGKKKISYFIEKYGNKEGKKKYKESEEKRINKIKGFKHTKESLEKIRKSSKGRLCSEERKRKIGAANRVKSIGNSSHLGCEHSDKTKELLRKQKLGKLWVKNNKLAQSKQINKDELTSYINNGWEKGRLSWKK